MQDLIIKNATALQTCIHNQKLQHPHSPRVVWYLRWPLSRCTHDTTWCLYSLECHLWYAQLHLQLQGGNQPDHWQTWDEAPRLWDRATWMGHHQATMGHSQCMSVDIPVFFLTYHTFITGFQGCNALFFSQWHSKHCICHICHGPSWWTPGIDSYKSHIWPSDQGCHCTWQKNSQQILQLHRS